MENSTISVIGITILLAGCSTTFDIAPFDKFVSSTAQLDSGIKTLGANLATYHRDIDVASINPIDDTDKHKIKLSTTCPSTTEDSCLNATFFEVKYIPVYFKYSEFIEKLSALTGITHNYAVILKTASQDKLDEVDQEKINSLKNQINDELLRLELTYSDRTSDQSANNVALMSATFSSLFGSYITNRKNVLLAKEIEKDKSMIVEVSQAMLTSINILADQWRVKYDSQFDAIDSELIMKLETLNKDSELRTIKQAYNEKFFELNEKSLKEIKAIEDLAMISKLLPTTHQNLVNALREDKLTVESLTLFTTSITEFKQDVDTLAQENRKDVFNAQYSDLTEYLNQLLIDANNAAHIFNVANIEFTKLKHEASIARQKANSTSNDANLEKAAAKAEEKVSKKEPEILNLKRKAEQSVTAYSEFKTKLETLNSGIDKLYGEKDE